MGVSVGAVDGVHTGAMLSPRRKRDDDNDSGGCVDATFLGEVAAAVVIVFCGAGGGRGL